MMPITIFFPSNITATVNITPAIPNKIPINMVTPSLLSIPKDRVKIPKAGTKFVNRKLLSNGGRVLSVTAIGKDLSKIRHKIIKIIKKLNWRAGFYRKDIGWKIIKKNENN